MTFDDATTRLLRNASASPLKSRFLRLTVSEGPDAGKVLQIDDAAHRQVLVGKSAACDLRLTDSTVSRRHVALELDDKGLVLRDLGSSNGTEVEGVTAREVVLRGGETIRLGGSAIRIELGSEEHVVPAPDEAHFGAFVGASPAARRLYPELEKLAAQSGAVLLEGEAGTGKELMAAAIHEAGPRKNGPFVVFERGSGTVQEAEEALFGRGEAPGLLEQANGGTLFIHEVADLETSLQGKLLDALERKAVRRVGAAASVPLDVRCFASSSRDLDREVQEHRFREDLLEFLATSRIVVPPLRQRRADIAILTQLFWTQLGGDPTALSPALIQRFEQRSWQGNVRELARTVAAHLAASDSVELTASQRGGAKGDLIDAVLQKGLAFSRAREVVTTEFEQRYLEHMLKLHNGNVSRAAAASGISRRYFYRLRTR
jgi:DNA-binding NtrC family response regulator